MSDDTGDFETFNEKEPEGRTIGDGKADTGDAVTSLFISAVVFELAKDLFEGITEDKVGEADKGLDKDDRGADDELDIEDEDAETDNENVAEGDTETGNEGENGELCFFPASITVVFNGLSFTPSSVGHTLSLVYEFRISLGFLSNEDVCVGTTKVDGF